ncbi:MAG TPA: ABATE domain-containing protein, partial [Mycobacterium sp.]|nr:ABATE domain-containing protein [Mycobacterium sp.]
MSSAADWHAVLLDLLNTTPVVDGHTVDRLDGRWLRAHGAPKDVDAARAVRDDLQRVVRREADASVLRRHLTDVRQVPDIGPDGIAWSLEADWRARI